MTRPDVSKLRRDLDTAVDAALPHSGGRVRAALHQLRNALADLDRERARTTEASATWPDWVRDGVRDQAATHPVGVPDTRTG